jgi:hypothetical protein
MRRLFRRGHFSNAFHLDFEVSNFKALIYIIFFFDRTKKKKGKKKGEHDAWMHECSSSKSASLKA